MGYKVRVVRDEAGLAQLEDAWSRLLTRSHSASIFSSFGWNMAWWHSYGKGKELYVAVASDSQGCISGIAPLMLDRSGPVRTLQFIGAGLSDTGDFVLDAGCAGEVVSTLMSHLRRLRREWDLLDLDEVPDYSLLAGRLRTVKPPGLHLVQLPRTDCPYIPLPASWEAYIATLQRKPRQHLESFARRVVQETGAYFRVVTDEESVPAAVARFYALHRARWSTKEDALNPEHLSPVFQPFLEEACRRSAREGSLRLSELCAGDDVVASWISFQVNGRLNGYMTGFDPAWSSKRPGKILHGFVVRQALSEGAHEIDFGRGAEPYKYEMGAVNRRNQRFVLGNNTPRSLSALGLFKLRIYARALLNRYREAQSTRVAQRTQPGSEAEQAETN